MKKLYFIIARHGLECSNYTHIAPLTSPWIFGAKALIFS
jgi:hypothetical protein